MHQRWLKICKLHLYAMQMNIWKIIYLNYGERYKGVMIDHHSSCEIKAVQAWIFFRL